MKPKSLKDIITDDSACCELTLYNIECLFLQRNQPCMLVRSIELCENYIEQSEVLFGIIPLSTFYHHTSHHRSRFHPYNLESLHLSRERFQISFLSCTSQIWNEVLSLGFHQRGQMFFFKRSLRKVLNCRQWLAPLIADVLERR